MEVKPTYEELERRVQELEKIKSELEYSREALRESENLFRMLYDKAPLGYQSLDENGHFMVVNKTWLETLGYQEEEVMGKSFADFLHPDWREHFKENFPQFKAIGEILGVEFEMVKKNGDLILVSFTGKISRGEKGNFQQTHCIFHDITNRKRAAEALLESERRFRTLIMASNDVIYQMNPEWSEMRRLSGGNFFIDTLETNTNWLQEYIHPDDQSQVKAVINKAVMHKSVFEFEHRVFRADGTVGWTSSRAVPLLDSDGQIIEWFGAASDITARKQAEEALKASEERFNLAMDACRDGVYEWDLKTREIYYSPGWKRMLGYEPNELPDDFSVWEKLTRPEDVENSWQILQEVIEGKRERFELEFEMRHKEGHWIHVLSRSNIYKDATGQPARVIGTHVDITESKRQRERLSLSESRYRKAQALAKVGNWEYNLKTTEYWGSDEARNIFGLDPDKDSSATEEVESCIIERERVHQALVDLIEKGKPHNLEFDIITKNTGEKKTVVSIAEIEKDEAKNPIKISGVIHDITERKHHEQQLSTALNEKEVLLREVHHRVKNNLAAIISLMDLQRRNLKDADCEDILTELSNRIRSMSLIHEKLYRADSLANIDFEDYTHALISHLRTAFGSPCINYRVDAPGITIPLDLASPCGLIVNELMTNVLKYAFPGGKPRPGNTDCQVLVRLQRDKDTYTLTVADNGMGWPAGFDWTKTRTLGLTLVRMLGQHQLGGSYVVDQENGTSITLTFTDRKEEALVHG